MCMCLCVGSTEVKDGIRFPGVGVIGCDLPYVGSGNPGHLEEECVLLTTEPSLQSSILPLYKSKVESSLFLFLYRLPWIFKILITSILVLMQINPSLLYIIMFNDLTVEIKICFQIFRIKNFGCLI